jgi:hypothetical protein
MDRTHTYAALADALTRRGFDTPTIEKYGQLWDSVTPADGLPCPLCYTYSHKRAALKLLPDKAGKQPMRCRGCMSLLYVPLPA